MSAVPQAAATAQAVSSPYRLLVVNGNTTSELTSSLASQAEAFYGGSVHIHAVTAGFGPAYIASRAEAARMRAQFNNPTRACLWFRSLCRIVTHTPPSAFLVWMIGRIH